MFVLRGIGGTIWLLLGYTDLDRIGPWRNEWEETKPKVVIENQGQLHTVYESVQTQRAVFQ
jgi:hypothetical protein